MLTHSVYYWEALGPLLIFIPFWNQQLKLLTSVGFILMHAGFGICMRLGVFIYIPAIAVLVLLPAYFWDDLFFPFMKKKFRSCQAIFYPENCLHCQNLILTLSSFFLLPGTRVIPIREDKRLWNCYLKVVDHRGSIYQNAQALCCLCQSSPMLFPLSFILSSTYIQTGIDKLLDIAHHGHHFSSKYNIITDDLFSFDEYFKGLNSSNATELPSGVNGMLLNCTHAKKQKIDVTKKFKKVMFWMLMIGLVVYIIFWNLHELKWYTMEQPWVQIAWYIICISLF